MLCSDSPFGAWLDVWLDGERIVDVIAASEEDGWVDVKCRDERGLVLFESHSLYLRKRYHGEVKIIGRPDMPSALRLLYMRVRADEALEGREEEPGC